MNKPRFIRPKRGASAVQQVRHHKVQENAHLLEAQALLRGTSGKTLNERQNRYRATVQHLEFAQQHATQGEPE